MEIRAIAPPHLSIAVIGGGAAGFFGAIAAAEHPGVRVTVFEAGREVLSKVLISGGGRCNVTHACFEPAQLVQNYPRGTRALRGPFTRFQPRDTVAWFQQRGVRLKTEADGRMFPITDQAATIATCLVQVAKGGGVTVRTQTPVTDVRRTEAGFELTLRSGHSFGCDRLLLATGSSPQGRRLAQRLGHTIVPPVPSLFTFAIRDRRLQDLAGVSVNAVALHLQAGQTNLNQQGPLLLTHWGLSGPAVLKLSAWGARALSDCRYRAALTVNWLPESNPNDLRQHLQAVKVDWAPKAIASLPPVPLPRRLWRSLALHTGIAADDRWAHASKATLHRLTEVLTRSQFAIAGKGAFKDEFVTCGGIPLDEVNFKSMASRCCPGLYLAGEVLDIDGVTGGFNFQSAWTTAWIAGHAMAEV